MSGNRAFQEFYWTPTEFVDWLRRAAEQFDLWICRWAVGGNAVEISRSDLDNLHLEKLPEGSVQIFVGAKALSSPTFVESAGRRVIDFRRSYAVQLIPPLVVDDGKTLLQGYMAVLRRDQYDDRVGFDQLLGLLGSLRRSMRAASASGHVVMQRIAGGASKLWRDILVGREVVQSDGFQLKQFGGGAVTFEVVVDKQQPPT